MNKKIRSNFQIHPFHLVSPSPWPFFTSLSLFNLTSNAALAIHNFSNAYYTFYLSLFLVVVSMFFWFRDIVTEATYLGDHSFPVQKSIGLGIILFIVSEALFFLAIFWAFFHSALTPTPELGGSWPPLGLTPVNPFELPLLNTVILLSSGSTITYSHHALINGDRGAAILGAILTVILAIVFTLFQGVEYNECSFTMSDGAYGTCFFFGTGFHGFHVIIGTIFIFVALVRMIRYHLTINHHVGFEGSISYWHFVDVVWLFLYLAIYYWGS